MTVAIELGVLQHRRLDDVRGAGHDADGPVFRQCARSVGGVRRRTGDICCPRGLLSGAHRSSRRHTERVSAGARRRSTARCGWGRHAACRRRGRSSAGHTDGGERRRPTSPGCRPRTAPRVSPVLWRRTRRSSYGCGGPGWSSWAGRGRPNCACGRSPRRTSPDPRATPGRWRTRPADPVAARRLRAASCPRPSAATAAVPSGCTPPRPGCSDETTAPSVVRPTRPS